VSGNGAANGTGKHVNQRLQTAVDEQVSS